MLSWNPIGVYWQPIKVQKLNSDLDAICKMTIVKVSKNRFDAAKEMFLYGDVSRYSELV